MSKLAIALTLGLSLSHPNAFGAAWYLLALACIGLGIGHARFLRRPSSALSVTQSGMPTWMIWLIAFGPLTLLSIVSVIVFRLNPSRAEVIELFFGGLAFAVGLQYLRPRASTLWSGLMLAAAIALLLSLYEFFVLHQPRIGIVFHPINFALSCGAALLMLLLGRMVNLETSTAKDSSAWLSTRLQPMLDNPWMVNAAILATTIALLGSGSRGPIIGVVVCLGLALMLLRSQRSALPRFRIGSGLLLWAALFAAAAAVVFAVRFGTDIQLGAESSIGKRWKLIVITVEQIQQTPWLGIGTDQAGKFFATFPGPIASLDHAHVTLLNLGLELGLPGIISWLWAFGVLAWAFSPWRRQHQPALAMIGLMTCIYIFICALTQDFLSHAYTRKYLAFVIALLLTLTHSPADHPEHA